MTDMHIPQHITLTRRIAQQEAAAVTALTVAEQQLKTQLDEHQRDASAERDRIEAELLAAREKAEKHLEALAETGRRLTSELTGVGRQLQRHHDEATEAQHTVLAWCTRAGINPADLPPLPDTGPLPAIAAPVNGTTTGSTQVVKEFPTTPPAEPLPAIEDPGGLLEAGRRAADPNGDPGATRVDSGGDEPEQGRFQEGRDA